MMYISYINNNIKLTVENKETFFTFECKSVPAVLPYGWLKLIPIML